MALPEYNWKSVTFFSSLSPLELLCHSLLPFPRLCPVSLLRRAGIPSRLVTLLRRSMRLLLLIKASNSFRMTLMWRESAWQRADLTTSLYSICPPLRTTDSDRIFLRVFESKGLSKIPIGISAYGREEGIRWRMWMKMRLYFVFNLSVWRSANCGISMVMDGIIVSEDLQKANDSALSSIICHRFVKSLFARRSSSLIRMIDFRLFTYLLICTEDKTILTSINFWFRLCGLDANGITCSK
jgi:hypothetical protein